MARGAWARAVTGPLVAAGAEIDIDPYGLFGDGQGGDRMPYNPAILEAMQNQNVAVV